MMPTPAVQKGLWRDVHSNTHLRLFLDSGGSRAANIASSNTFFRPFCVSAEHSTYLTAFRSRASFSAVSGVIGFCLFLASFSILVISEINLGLTSKEGVFGQWWVISGTHFSFTFSNEDGETTEEADQETHLSMDSSAVATCHSPPALQYQKSKSIWLCNHNCDSIVVQKQLVHTQMEICWLCVGWQETRFTNSTITHNNTLNCLHCWNSFAYQL